jgi:hypothetical protein
MDRHGEQEAFPYATPAAFRAGLSARFKTIAATGQYTVQQLGRHLAYDRLLARVFSGVDADQWVLKGGGALLVRLEGARHSVDLDLFRSRQGLDGAEQALRAAAARDLGDFFRFDVGPGQPLIDVTKGIRLPVQSLIGPRPFERFSVDLVTHGVMTGVPDQAAPILAPLVRGLASPPYRLYPLADHLADKVCAVVETHVGADGVVRPSTRVKDLVDVVTVAATQRIEATGLITALESESARRGLRLPAAFAVPDPALWGPGYARLARGVPAIAAYQSFPAGLALANTFLDPILSRTRLAGTWAPTRWSEP